MRRWTLELLEGEARCVLSLFYTGPSGRQVVWDTHPLPHLSDSPSETEILDELYGGLLHFMEERGALRQ